MSQAEVKISQVTKTFAEVIVNGTSHGKREINGGPSLKEFAEGLAAEFGVRTFNIVLDGQTVRSSAVAAAPVPAGASVEVRAKDTRGAHEGSAEETAPEQAAKTKPITDSDAISEPQADGNSTETLSNDGATS